MFEKIKNNKLLLFISVLIVIVVVLLLSRFTYAYLKSENNQTGITEGNITASGDRLIFTKGTDLALNLSTDTFNSSTEGNITASTSPSVTLIANAKTNEAKATYSTGIDITRNTFVSSDNQPELILQVKCDNEEIIKIDNLEYNESLKGFDITGKTGIINAAVDKEITSQNSVEGVTHTWEYTVVLINKEIDQSINENAEFKAKVYIEEIERLPIEEVLLANSNKDKTTLYFHNDELEGGAQDESYRYAGSSEEVKNFVCLDGETTEGECANGDADLYRIIGLFKNGDNRYEIKLIKYDYATNAQLGTTGAYKDLYNAAYSYSRFGNYYKGTEETYNTIGAYYWTSSTNQVNEWAGSALRETNLNDYYLNTYLKGTKHIDIDNLIETHTWSLNGHSSREVTPKVMYDNEMGKIASSPYVPTVTKEVQDKIGLMYASDYGYAANPSSTSNWSTSLGDQHNDTVTNNNWIYRGLSEWIISRYSANNHDALYMSITVYVNNTVVYTDALGVRPSFYLSSATQIKNGDGSKTNPYRLLVG